MTFVSAELVSLCNTIYLTETQWIGEDLSNLELISTMSTESQIGDV